MNTSQHDRTYNAPRRMPESSSADGHYLRARMVLGALGSLGVIVSIFLSWRTGAGHPSGIPIAFLWDHTTAAQNPSLLIALIPLAIILVVGTAMRGGAAPASSAAWVCSSSQDCSPTN